MPVFLIPPNSDLFPHPSLADPSGLLAVGGRLSVESLYNAYCHGIFPWYSEGQPILWYCILPRFVLFPNEFTYPRSLRPLLNRDAFEVTFNRDFGAVIDHCQKVPRPGQPGTWITAEMKRAYRAFHEAGYVESVEVWEEGELVGGLYGVRIGRVFSGESMFTLRPDASKYGLVKLVERLREEGCMLIDCQQETEHLARFGARMIDGTDFLWMLRKNRVESIKL